VIASSSGSAAGKPLQSGAMSPATSPGRVALSEVFTSECIEPISGRSSKKETLRRLVEVLVEQRRLAVRHCETVTRRLIERERYVSSAIGKGLAFPHLRTNDVDQFVGAIGVASPGIDFESLDQQPTRLVFLALSPSVCREQHVDLLSRLVSLMQDKTMSMRMNHLIDAQSLHRYLCDLDDQSGVHGNADPIVRPTRSDR
jgi:mannitol/fructose-specific phosphotransferase system IIA component (Ntr-type)